MARFTTSISQKRMYKWFCLRSALFFLLCLHFYEVLRSVHKTSKMVNIYQTAGQYFIAFEIFWYHLQHSIAFAS